MSSGELRNRINFQAPTRVGDDMGGSTTTYVAVASDVAAKAWTVSSSEALAGGQITMTRVQKFKIRYRSVLKPDWRIEWDGRYFAVTGIDPDEKRAYIFLTCKEVVQ